MKEKLADRGTPVSEIMWIKWTSYNRETSTTENIETTTVRLEFIGEVPKEVFLGFIRYQVEDYIPEPTQCFNCQSFGHVSTHCNTTVPRCVQCGVRGHRKSEGKCRPGKINCANCQGRHKAWSKICQFYLKEVEALKIRGRTKASMHTSRTLSEDLIVPSYLASKKGW